MSQSCTNSCRTQGSPHDDEGDKNHQQLGPGSIQYSEPTTTKTLTVTSTVCISHAISTEKTYITITNFLQKDLVNVQTRTHQSPFLESTLGVLFSISLVLLIITITGWLCTCGVTKRSKRTRLLITGEDN